MAVTVKEKLKEEARKAEETLFNSQIGLTPNNEDKPKTENNVEKGETPKEVPAVQDVSTLTAELEGLKLQLADENNPTWKTRYFTLQGMFNKTNEELKSLKLEVKELKESSTKVETKPLDTPLTASETLAKLQQDYGNDILTDLTKYFFKMFKDSQKDTNDRIEKVEAKQGQSESNIFYSNLTILVPDWKKINGWEPDGIPRDPKWTKFLSKTVPGMNITYDQVLVTGHEALDANAVARIFNLYKETQNSVKPPEKPSIEKFIDPGSSKATSEIIPDEVNTKKTYPKKVIDDFYNSIAKKTFRGTYAERVALDDEYQLAILEGRVT